MDEAEAHAKFLGDWSMWIADCERSEKDPDDLKVLV